jgi:translation initiation factor 4B
VLRGRPIRVALLSGDQRVGDRDRNTRTSRGPAEDEGVDNWRDMARGQGADFSRPTDNNFRNNRPSDDFRRDENFRASSDNFRQSSDNFRRPGPERNDFEDEWRGGQSQRQERGDRGQQEEEFVRGPTQPRNYERSAPRPERQERAERKEDEEPKERKKLILLPKSTQLKEELPSVRSSIFGEAKPVDTLKREMEIEEKLQNVHVEEKVVR